MRINWAALGVVSTVAIACVTGVWSLTSAAQTVATTLTAIKVEQISQGKQLDNLSSDQVTVKRRVDFIYEQFFKVNLSER